MKRDLYSNKDFTEIKKRINAEILRRSTFKWWDPMATPTVGTDRTSPLSLPDIGERVPVDDKTYTINTPSDGSIEPTKNIQYRAHGDSPGGDDYSNFSIDPETTAAHFTYDEMRNFLVGLAKIHDIYLYYGRDEVPGLAYRDPQPILDVLEKAEADKLHEPATGSVYIPDPNRGTRKGKHPTWPNIDALIGAKIIDGNLIQIVDDTYEIPKLAIDEEGNLILDEDRHPDEIELQLERFHYHIHYEDGHLYVYADGLNFDDPYKKYAVKIPVIDGVVAMPSGEFDGEELNRYESLGPSHFFDDYGADPGDGNYHPFSPGHTPTESRDVITHDDHRRLVREHRQMGGHLVAEYGENPRNPVKGEAYPPRPVFKGVPSTCQTACTGLCSLTCDDFCSQSCETTCWNRCGNACTDQCTTGCSGCSTQCYTTCKTKCENTTGYACLNAGAKAVKITTSEDGKVHMETEYHSCGNTCSYSCQYYPNKKTTCWDSGCMGNCFTSCMNSCADSCTGSCVGNDPEQGSDYKTGKGTGCSAACTLNCIGTCEGTCQGDCFTECYQGCMSQCYDNCTWDCSSTCGSGCSTNCIDWCTGCSHSCDGTCRSESESVACRGCSASGGCASICQQSCNGTCLGIGCNSICGSGTENNCSANCRISCLSSSCTSLCSDQCSDMCTTCVNSCDMQCGACSSECSSDCSSKCAIFCTEECKNSCANNCSTSCSEACGGCSTLCFSCVSQCIGVCMLKCEQSCSHCANQCSWWCDQTCDRKCLNSCEQSCTYDCTASCISFSTSETVLPTNPDMQEHLEAGWVDPNAVARIKRQGRNLLEEVEDRYELADAEIQQGDLILDDNDSPASDSLENLSFYINENNELIMVADNVYTRGDQMEELLNIKEWYDEWKDKQSDVQKDSK